MDPDLVRIAQLAVIALATGAGVIALWGVARWISSRTLRKPPEGQPALNSDARLERLEMAIDAIAIEVERISESQRFTAKIMAERSPNQLPPAE